MIKSKNTKGLKGSVDCIDSDELKTLKADKKSLERQLDEAREAIESILHITYDSEGVAGYHNNGDTALWGEFEELAMAEHFLEQLKEKGDE